MLLFVIDDVNEGLSKGILGRWIDCYPGNIYMAKVWFVTHHKRSQTYLLFQKNKEQYDSIPLRDCHMPG